MRALAARLPEVADQAKRVAVMAALDSLFDNTPADTSKLVSNWRVTSSAVGEPVPAYVLGQKGNTKAASILAARASALAELSAIPLGRQMVIYNSVPYGRYVNDGTSHNAPSLFLEKARVAASEAARSFKRSVGVTRG